MKNFTLFDMHTHTYRADALPFFRDYLDRAGLSGLCAVATLSAALGLLTDRLRTERRALAVYMLTGGLANYMVTSIPDAIDYQAEYTGTFGYRFGDLLLNLIVPLQDFFVTGHLANGELIGFPFISCGMFMNEIVRMDGSPRWAMISMVSGP